MDYSTLVTSFDGLSTIYNQQAGVPAAIASLKFINAAANNYRFRNDSDLISGGSLHASDGKDVGADIDLLEQETGKVTLIGTPTSNLTSSSSVVAFIAPDSQACPVDVSTVPSVIGNFSRFADSGTTRIRNVAISGLISATTYYYRVECAVQQHTGVFRTLVAQ